MSAEARVLIAMPAYGGSIRTMTVNSLLQLQLVLGEQSVEVDYDFTSYAEITAVRNLMATRFLERPDFTHLLFIDSDMAFHAETVLRLIRADRPLVGCFYPQRHPGGGVVGITDRVLKVPQDGLVAVSGIGMGLCLIRRDCLEALSARPEVPRFFEHPFQDDFPSPLVGFFNGNSDGVWLSEDYAFCKRWAELCDGTIWALVREEIGHIGEKVFVRDLSFDLLAPSADVLKRRAHKRSSP